VGVCVCVCVVCLGGFVCVCVCVRARAPACVCVTLGLQVIKTLAKCKQLKLKFQGMSGRQGMQHDYTFYI